MKWLIVTLLSLALWVASQWPDGKLRLVFCDVGQGDAQLAVLGSLQVLIDGGPTSEGVLRCLADHVPFWDRKIEIVIVSHAQKDHAGGLPEVFKRYQIGSLMLAKSVTEVALKEELLRLAKADGVRLIEASLGSKFKTGGLEIEVVWPPERRESVEDLNQESLVVKLRLGGVEALFTGDIGVEEELAIIASGLLTKTAVLKVPHHGSKYSSSEEWVSELRPEIAVIEVGAKNSYGHPNGDIVKRYDTVGSIVKRTDRDGTVVVTTDGKRLWVR